MIHCSIKTHSDILNIAMRTKCKTVVIILLPICRLWSLHLLGVYPLGIGVKRGTPFKYNNALWNRYNNETQHELFCTQQHHDLA